MVLGYNECHKTNNNWENGVQKNGQNLRNVGFDRVLRVCIHSYPRDKSRDTSHIGHKHYAPTAHSYFIIHNWLRRIYDFIIKIIHAAPPLFH